MSTRSTVITRIVAEDGTVGEAYAGDEDHALPEIVRIIEREIAPRFIGEDIMAPERCWATARPVTANILRDRRWALVACACVDAAMWDAVGKRLGLPLGRLWGGYRSSLPIIAIGGYYGNDIGAEVEKLRGMGFAGMKFKVGTLSGRGR